MSRARSAFAFPVHVSRRLEVATTNLPSVRWRSSSQRVRSGELRNTHLARRRSSINGNASAEDNNASNGTGMDDLEGPNPPQDSEALDPPIDRECSVLGRSIPLSHSDACEASLYI